MKILVIGCGRLGAGLAKTLELRRHTVTIVDKDPAVSGQLGTFKGKTVAGSGIDREALLQADLLAHLVAEEMSLGDMTTLLKLRKGLFSLVEEKIHPDSTAAGKALREVRLPDKSVLAAVIRKGELIAPHGNMVLEPADEIVALVHASQLSQLAALLGAREVHG